MTVPVDCQPMCRYKWVAVRSLLIQIILNMPWFNWSTQSIQQIKLEINSLEYLQYSPAKNGFWFKYKYKIYNTKIPVEIFVRTIELT